MKKVSLLVFMAVALAALDALAAPFQVYDDGALKNSWWDNSGVTHNLSSVGVTDGTLKTISVNYTGWSALNFFGGTYSSTANQDSISIRVYGGGNVSPKFLFKAYFSVSGWSPAVRLDLQCPGGIIPQNTWVTCLVPLSTLGTFNGNFGGIYLQEGAGKTLTTVYFGSISLGQYLTPPPPDTTLPTVSLTNPTQNSTQSGSINLTATASDNVGVAGVQFVLDGLNYLSEDTTAPYSVSLNTTTLAFGPHTVSALARDAVNNAATSSVVTFNVDNTPPTPTGPSGPTSPTGPTATGPTGPTGGGTGVTTYTTLASLPTHSDGVPTSAQWPHGATMIVKDVVGGDLVAFFKGNSSYHAAVSVNSGLTWTWKDPASAVNPPAYPVVITQSSDGNVHMIGWSWAYGVTYNRFGLVRDSGGHVTSFNAQVLNVAFPSNPNAADLSADLVAGTDGSGNPTLFFALYDDQYNSVRGGRVVAGKTSLTAGYLPSTSSDFVKLDGTAGFTQLDLMTTDPWASPHNAGVFMAQHPVSKDVWFQWGPLSTNDGITGNTLPIKRLKASSNGSNTFSLGSIVTVAAFTGGFGVQNQATLSTSNAVWFMYTTPTQAIVIDKADSLGNITSNAIPSPFTNAHSSGHFTLNVSNDETKAWFAGRVGYDVDVSEPRIVKYWNGSVWTSFSDNSPGDGFRAGRSSGWNSGLVWMQSQFDYSTHRPLLGTIRTE